MEVWVAWLSVIVGVLCVIVVVLIGICVLAFREIARTAARLNDEGRTRDAGDIDGATVARGDHLTAVGGAAADLVFTRDSLREEIQREVGAALRSVERELDRRDRELSLHLHENYQPKDPEGPPPPASDRIN